MEIKSRLSVMYNIVKSCDIHVLLGRLYQSGGGSQIFKLFVDIDDTKSFLQLFICFAAKVDFTLFLV